MEQYIPKSALVAEIKRRMDENRGKQTLPQYFGMVEEDLNILSLIDTLEVKDMDLEKLGEIARHLIAVKEHIEDMRLDKEEWFMLEKIGYPEKFKAQKGE